MPDLKVMNPKNLHPIARHVTSCRGDGQSRLILIMNQIRDDARDDQDDSNLVSVSKTKDEIIHQFVEHWGMMARSWGINSTMGELFALLYITGSDWTADGLREGLKVSRGNVSMNLRELMSWGVVHKVHRSGERREFFRAEADVWTLFRRILGERKRRELDPTLLLLKRTETSVSNDEGQTLLRDRISSLHHFFALIDTLAARLLTLEPGDLAEIRQLFEEPGDPRSGV